LNLFNVLKSEQEPFVFVYQKKKNAEKFVRSKKVLTFAPANRKQNPCNAKDIVLWCNGNTSDSGPEIPGSSPGRTTKEMLSAGKSVFSICFLSYPVIINSPKIAVFATIRNKMVAEEKNVIRFACSFFPTTSVRVLAC
jgi:hypothetical protein